MTIDELNALEDNQNWQQYVAQTRVKKPQQQKKKGFWKDQISTGGGISGAIAGGIAGAAIGAPAGGIGAIPGGLVGAIIGGFGGGSAGQYIENGVVGEDDMSKDVLKEGALNGLFAVGPIRGANVALQGGKAVLGRAGGMAVRESVERAATATPIRTAIGQKFGTSLQRNGQKLLGTQANLTRADIRKLGPGGAPADVLGTINASTGLHSLDDMSTVGSNVTGTNGILSELSRNAIGNSKGVDIGDLRTVAEDLIINQAPLLSDSARKNVLNQVQNSVVKSYGGSKGSLSTLANPLDAFDAARGFEKMAAKIRTSPTVAPADEQLAGVYSTLAKTMTDRLYKAPGVDQGVQLARQEAAQRFRQLAAEAPSKSQRSAYLKLADETEKLTDVKSIRSAQSPFVKLSKIDEKTAAAEAGAGMRLTDQAQGLGKLVQKPLNLLALPVEAASPRVAGAMTRMGSKLSNVGGGSSNPVNPAAMAGRMGLLGALTSEGANPAPATEQELSLDEALMSVDQGEQMSGDMSGEMVAANPFGVSREQVAQQMLMALQSGDTKGFATLKDLYDMIDEYESAGAGGDLSAAAQKQMTAAANGEETLNSLEEALSAAGGGSGTLGRLRSFLPGELDPSAKLYNDSLQGYVPAILQALGKTDAPSEAELKGIIRALPQVTDTPENAAKKLADLRRRIRAAQQNSLTYGSGGSSSYPVFEN